MAAIDHLVVSARSLDEGADWVEAALGARPGPGGVHASMGTHNRLLGLGPDLYLEVIAADPAAPHPGRARWFALDGFAGAPRLTHWVVRVDDLDAALASAPEGAGVATPFARGDFRWRFGLPGDGRLPFGDAFPALIEWEGAAHPAPRLPDSGLRLDRLEIVHPRAKALAAALPLGDPRIAVREGPPEFAALFSGPGGPRHLPSRR